MGASSWCYFARYQPDMNKVLQELREEDFRKGRYYNLVHSHLEYLRKLDYKDYNPYEHHPRYRLSETELTRLKTLSQPETAEDLIKIQADSGTHCAIDIDGISSTPDYRMASPVSKEQLIGIFGTEKPTRSMVEKLKDRVIELFPTSWMALYFTIYKDDAPDEWFIYGITGD